MPPSIIYYLRVSFLSVSSTELVIFFKTLADNIAITNFYVVGIRNRDKWYLMTEKVNLLFILNSGESPALYKL